MQTSSPGAISRTNVAPTMSSAAVSLATTQPPFRRPSTSGRKPCGSRAAYSVCSSMKTSEYAPLASGRTAAAAASTPVGPPAEDPTGPPAEARPGIRPAAPAEATAPAPAEATAGAPAGAPAAATGGTRPLTNSAVSTSVSEVAAIPPSPWPVSPSSAASSRVLIRFPLCPSARLVVGVERNVGWALAHTEAPVVEYRQCPTAMWPRSAVRAGSSKTWATRPISLCTTMRLPSLTAMPADSCPRCCSAYSP